MERTRLREKRGNLDWREEEAQALRELVREQKRVIEDLIYEFTQYVLKQRDANGQ